MYALIAAIPIFLTVILMVGFNWPAKRALPASWLIACFVAGFIWKMEIPELPIRNPRRPRACLKNHSCNLHAPLCVEFGSHSVDAACFLIQTKSPTNCDIHLTESIFKTRSSRETADPVGYGSFSFVYCSVSQFLILILFLHMRR